MLNNISMLSSSK